MHNPRRATPAPAAALRHALLVPLLAALCMLGACSGRNLPETCYLKPESGSCRASFTRWYLDDRTGICKAFIWGGCGGVAPFETQADCAAQCMPGKVVNADDGASLRQVPAAPAAGAGAAAPEAVTP